MSDCGDEFSNDTHDIGHRRMTRRWKHLLRWLLGGLLCSLVLTLPWATWRTIKWNEQQAYERLAAQGRDRLTLYGVALHSELEKSRNIPVVLSTDHEVAALLTTPAKAGQPDEPMLAFDRRLERLSASLGVSAVYMLDRHGVILAASNWNEGAGSFVGQHLDFRPYFVAATEGREGRTFAVGSTANQPGFYIAMPVWSGGSVVGAVAVKTLMDDMEHGWSGGGERVFVTDRYGVVAITNTPQWRFHSLAPLSPAALGELRSNRQYGDEPLPALNLIPGKVLTSVDGTDYVMVSQPMPDGDGWTLHVLLGVKEAQAGARDRGLLAVAGMGLAIFGLYFVFHRGRMLRRHTRELESRVSERTAALLASNQRLQNEIVERRRAEVDLKSKQDELVQAAKLAALGQMSAGMAHEINQPLAAIRSFADNAVTLIDLGRTKIARDNLSEIAGLTERMARITGQLKQFARKSSGQMEAVAVIDIVEGAVALLASSLRTDDVVLSWVPPAAVQRVWGDEVRLQQVMINLLRNALDAVRNVDERHITVEVSAGPTTVSIAVHDSGRGIDLDAMARLFDPFFTTKPAGEGLGLGLSISEGIVRDLGGQLSASNHPDGGAVFTITLPRMEVR